MRLFNLAGLRRWLWPVAVALYLAGAGPGSLRPASAQNCWSTGSTGIAFGATGPEQLTDGQGTANLTCQAGATQRYLRWCLTLPAGAPVAGIAPRYMGNYNGSQMAFDLYSDAARTQIIGPPPTGGGYPAYTGTAIVPGGYAQLPLNVPVYGRVPAAQNLPAVNPYASLIGSGEFAWAMSAGAYPASCTSGGATGLEDFFMSVTASVSNQCRISLATDLDFGVVSTLTSNHDQTSMITVRCPTGTSWSLGLNNGTNANGAIRRMRNGTQYVTYEMYRDTGRTQRWGNVSGQWATGTGAGVANPTNLTVYGRVPVQATVPGGNYSDTVTVTLTY